MKKNIPPHLRWACRRGMLELDVLLEEQYVMLSLPEQTSFEALLSSSDQDLFMWLTGKEEAKEPFKILVKKIRDHAYARRSS